MKHYRHFIICSPGSAPDKVWRQLKDGIETLQEQGYRMVDYHDTQAFTVLVFERDDEYASAAAVSA